MQQFEGSGARPQQNFLRVHLAKISKPILELLSKYFYLTASTNVSGLLAVITLRWLKRSSRSPVQVIYITSCINFPLSQDVLLLYLLRPYKVDRTHRWFPINFCHGAALLKQWAVPSHVPWIAKRKGTPTSLVHWPSQGPAAVLAIQIHTASAALYCQISRGTQLTKHS